VRKGKNPAVKKEVNWRSRRTLARKKHSGWAEEGAARALIESNPALKQFRRQLLLDITSEGLRIQMSTSRTVRWHRPAPAAARASSCARSRPC
jgi:chemotaxis protein MotB